jgi:hypothetical protein
LPRKWMQWIGLGLMLASSLALALMLIPAPATLHAENAGSSSAAATARVIRTTLLDTRTETGTLGFGDPVDVPFISNERSGIVTWMAPEGAIVTRGEPLFAIDGQPVILFYGQLPVFRTLRFDGDSLADFEWLELNNAQDDERKAELNLALQRTRLAEAQVRLNDTRTHMEDSTRDEPTTPQFVRLAQAIAAARDRLHRIEQLGASGFTTPAEADQARYELAAAQADRDAAGRERVQQFAAAGTAVADAQLAVHQAERALRDAQDVRNALLSSANANADIDLLKENLQALGYDGSAADAIRRFQMDAGRSATGLIEPGQIVVAPGPVRVAAHLAEVGDVVFSGQSGQSGLAPGNEGSDPIVRYTGTDRTVTVSLTIADHTYARPGDSVIVTLPTDADVHGVITEVSTVFDDEGLAATVVDIPDQSALGTLEAASVDVEFVIGKREDVLAVPITALLALPDGGFGVDIIAGDNPRIVPVDTGLFARGNVEIDGVDIVEGAIVGIAR